jgi:hypothetical protein
MEQRGFELNNFTEQIMIIGLIMAVLTIFRGFSNPPSIITLFLNIKYTGFSLVLIVVFLGTGNIMSLGLTELEVAVEGVQSSLIMDLRVFVYISIVTILPKNIPSLSRVERGAL